MPEIPLYPGTRAVRAGAVPVVGAPARRGAGALAHAEFLAERRAAIRGALRRSLAAAFAGGACRSPSTRASEAEVLAAQARVFPELAASLDALRARLVDLLPVLRRSVYHPGFQGSFSLKRVAPALAPGFGFDRPAGNRRRRRGGARLARAGARRARRGRRPEARSPELRAYCARTPRRSRGVLARCARWPLTSSP